MKIKLRGHKSAQCHVIKDEATGTIKLVSYTTTVIIATPLGASKWALVCTGTYSRTTIKHISWFINEYFPACTYYDMKSIAGTGEAFKTVRRGV